MSGLDAPGDGDDAGDPATDGVDARVEAAEERIRELEAARDRLAAVESEIESVGEDAVVAAADAYRRAIRLLERYEG